MIWFSFKFLSLICLPKFFFLGGKLEHDLVQLNICSVSWTLFCMKYLWSNYARCLSLINCETDQKLVLTNATLAIKIYLYESVFTLICVSLFGFSNFRGPTGPLDFLSPAGGLLPLLTWEGMGKQLYKEIPATRRRGYLLTACNAAPSFMRPSKIQNGRQGPQNGWWGLERVCTPRVFGTPVNFCKMSFLIWALLLLEKVVTEKWKRENYSENSGSITSLSVECLNSDRKQHGCFCQNGWDKLGLSWAKLQLVVANG